MIKFIFGNKKENHLKDIFITVYSKKEKMKMIIDFSFKL